MNAPRPDLMHARDVMTAPVITVAPGTPLVEIVELMLKHRISAVPVVDEDGELKGIVSEGDLMHRRDLGLPPEKSWWLRALGGKVMLADDFVKAHAATAEELMSTNMVVVGEDTRLPEIARLLESHHIKRVPVVAKGSVVGIVSRANLLQALSLQTSVTSPSPNASDRELRDAILDALSHEAWSDLSHLNLVVRSGTVYLWGEVATQTQRKALVLAVREVPGVSEVVDNTRTLQTLY